MRKINSLPLLVSLLVPAATSAQQAVPPKVIEEMQGVWVSRFQNDTTEIEVRGTDIIRKINGKGLVNPPPIGSRTHAITSVRQEYDAHGSGDRNYKFNAISLNYVDNKWVDSDSDSGMVLLVMNYNSDSYNKLIPSSRFRTIVAGGDFWRPEVKRKQCAMARC